MTKKELSQLRYLNREIERDQRRLEELMAFAQGKAVTITGMPRGGGISDTVGQCAAEIADLKRSIEIKIQRSWRQLVKLQAFINGVEDCQLQEILTLRYVNGLSWNQVAVCIGGGNTADGVRKMHDRFLKN